MFRTLTFKNRIQFLAESGCGQIKNVWEVVKPYPKPVFRRRRSRHGAPLVSNRPKARGPVLLIFLSPGLKSDILHGKTGCTSRNLPLHRISCRSLAQSFYHVFPQIASLFFSFLQEVFNDFLYILLRGFLCAELLVFRFSSTKNRHFLQPLSRVFLSHLKNRLFSLAFLLASITFMLYLLRSLFVYGMILLKSFERRGTQWFVHTVFWLLRKLSSLTRWLLWNANYFLFSPPFWWLPVCSPPANLQARHLSPPTLRPFLQRKPPDCKKNWRHRVLR